MLMFVASRFTQDKHGKNNHRIRSDYRGGQQSSSEPARGHGLLEVLWRKS